MATRLRVLRDLKLFSRLDDDQNAVQAIAEGSREKNEIRIATNTGETG